MAPTSPEIVPPFKGHRAEGVELSKKPKGKLKKHKSELYTKDEDLEKVKGFAREHGCAIA